MKHKGWMFFILGCAATFSAFGQEFDRRAEIVGGDPDRGRCMVAVVVDGAAQVEIRRSEARLIDLSGAPAVWRHFECSTPMPRDPREFGFRGVSGRGRQQLVQPARDGGPAVVRIEDPQGGSAEYRFEIFWRGGDYRDRDDYRPGPPPPPVSSRWGNDEAVRSCQDAVREQARQRFRTDRIDFRRIGVDDAEGRREWVTGVLDVRWERDRVEPYRFSCSVDFFGRRIRDVQIDRLDRDRDRDRDR